MRLVGRETEVCTERSGQARPPVVLPYDVLRPVNALQSALSREAWGRSSLEKAHPALNGNSHRSGVEQGNLSRCDPVSMLVSEKVANVGRIMGKYTA